jgi:hypothetical protein
MVQIVLTCALQYESQILSSEWRAGHPKLATWLDEISERASIAATAPAPSP